MNYYDFVLKMYCKFKKLPIMVFGNFSNTSENKIDIYLFVQKPYLRTNYIESFLKEDIDLKNHYKKLKIYLIQQIHKMLPIKITSIICSTILV